MILELDTEHWPALIHIGRPVRPSGPVIHPLAYVCPVCLTNWGRLRWSVEDRPSYAEADRYVIIPCSCRRCNSPSVNCPIPGSLVPYWDLELLKDLPPDLLIREFILSFGEQSIWSNSAVMLDPRIATSLHTVQPWASTGSMTGNSTSA